jgi:hypothetical protein
LSYNCDWRKEEGILSFGALPCWDASAVLFAFGSKKQGVVRERPGREGVRVSDLRREGREERYI